MATKSAKTAAKTASKTTSKPKQTTKSAKHASAGKNAVSKSPVNKTKALAEKVVKKVPATKTAAKPVKPVAKAPVAKPVAKAAPVNVVAKPAPRPVAVQPVAKASAPAGKQSFRVNDYVVYPTHGVGRIVAKETETIGEYQLSVFVIDFEKDKMKLRVPVHRAEAAGLRGICGSDEMSRALNTLKGRAKAARGMWSRRAQEYEAKINSGNIVFIAEVVRDLHKNVDQSERSYSERMIYETALNRLIGEVAASDKIDSKSAHEKLLKVLKKQAA